MYRRNGDALVSPFALAARLLDRNFREPIGHGVGGIGRETQFQQRDRRDVKPSRSRATIDQHGDGHRDRSGFANDIETLLHSTAAGDDVLGDQDGFTRGERESAAKNEHVVFLFREEIASFRLSRDFLADDEPAHGGREHGCERVPLKFREEKLGESFDGIEALTHLRALKIMAAMQAGPEDEMPLLERSRANENVENLALNRIHGDGR